MRRDLLKYAGIAIVGLAVFVAVVLFFNRGSHVVIEGSIQNVRVQEMDAKSAVAIIDFRFVNPSDYPFIVREATVVIEDADGNLHTGMTVAESDTSRLFEYFPLLGPKYNPALKIRDRVGSRESMDRMICARFEIPTAGVEARRRLIIRVEDVDGVVSEITEQRGQASL